MSLRITESIISDVDGAEGANTVRLRIARDIDLTPEQEAQMWAAIQPWLDASRPTGGVVRVPGVSTPTVPAAPTKAPWVKEAEADKRQKIRAWVKAQGINIPDRGRIAQEYIDRYDEAQKGRTLPQAAPVAAPVAPAVAAAPVATVPVTERPKVMVTQTGGRAAREAEVWNWNGTETTVQIKYIDTQTPAWVARKRIYEQVTAPVLAAPEEAPQEAPKALEDMTIGEVRQEATRRGFSTLTRGTKAQMIAAMRKTEEGATPEETPDATVWKLDAARDRKAAADTKTTTKTKTTRTRKAAHAS